MAYDPALVERIRLCFGDSPVVEKKMFGGVAFMYRNYMCCGVNGNTLMLRVPRETHQEYLEKDYVREMDFTGKSLKGFIYVDADGVASDEALQMWVEVGRATVESLPPKE